MAFHHIFSAPRQVIRGSKSMPHVGSHPGNALLLIIISMTALAGLQSGGGREMVFGALAGFFAIGPIYAIGAWSRAQLSDRLERRARMTDLLDLWVSGLPDLPSSRIRVAFRAIKVGRTWRLHAWHDNPPYHPEIPATLVKDLEEILKTAANGRRRFRPEPEDLASMFITPRRLSAHERIALHARLSGPRSTKGLCHA